ncbi:DUF4184 family protein [Pontibacter silvestris]|uniref:DUF4184 family protein n=1 Tax=Pontibacter silvestris TaxID=2305183 RepID=A0ABW4WSB4_9BACT|nr:DUF4184 family protein [Pontibacter silvestris]MCC9137805.1 DUF4184 family protein [Pontibacter silvestris]
MPFTFSHPAIVLPGYYFPKKWRSLTGLIVGSVTPDFEMFLRMEAKNAFSHSWHSIFWFNLPLAIVLAFLFHLAVRNPLIDHLPAFLRQRLLPFKSFDWSGYFKRHYGIIVLSIIVGAASHIFWDSFTHAYGIFIRWFPALAQKVSVGNFTMPLFSFLQFAFSALGALIILYAILKLPRQKDFQQNINGFKYWSWVAVITISLTALRLASGLDVSYYPNIIVVIISAGLLGLMISPLLLNNQNSQ